MCCIALTACIIEECLLAINYLCFDSASLELRSAEFKIQIVMKLKIYFFVSLISRLPRKENYLNTKSMLIQI